MLKVCQSFWHRTLSCRVFDKANQIDEKYKWYNSIRFFVIQIMSRKVGRDYEVSDVAFFLLLSSFLIHTHPSSLVTSDGQL